MDELTKRPGAGSFLTDPTENQRRRGAAIAGHRGDEESARAGLLDPRPAVRATALAALQRMGAVTIDDLAACLGDNAEEVRRRAAEVAALHPSPELSASLGDRSPSVVEVTAWALGERGDPGALPALATTAADHPDPMCREAAVAAIGAIAGRPSSEEIPNQSDIGGSEDSPEGLEAVLSALSDRPAVRRRAVIALAAFDGPRVRSALAEALSDRDWQVRQAAEDQLGD